MVLAQDLTSAERQAANSALLLPRLLDSVSFGRERFSVEPWRQWLIPLGDELLAILGR